jgi:hypothetical protein
MGAGRRALSGATSLAAGWATGGTGNMALILGKKLAIDKALQNWHVLMAAAATLFIYWAAIWGLAVTSLIEPGGLSGTRIDGFIGGEPTDYALDVIPPGLVDIYRKAQARYGVAWSVLAAINSVETGFGRDVRVSPAGAVGWMQIMPATWSGTGNPNARNDKASPAVDTDPHRISQYGGYGVDADGDGAANPYSPADAIFSAAHILQKNGFLNDPEQAIYRYNQDYSYVRKVLDLAARFGSMAPAADGDPVWPVPPNFREIESPFGSRPDPFDYSEDYHYGIDIAVPEGTPVYAVAGGQAIFAGNEQGYGRCVQIRHSGYITLYGHLSDLGVHPGDMVSAGQAIALSGSTGKSTGPHLHFGVMLNGQFVDPALLFKNQ